MLSTPNLADSKQSLRTLSQLHRLDSPPDYGAALACAKKAIELDISDPKGWCCLANCNVWSYFNLMGEVKALDTTLKAYNKSESLLKGNEVDPDLYHNRAKVLAYLMDYNAAIINYEKSHQIDPTLESQAEIQSIRRLLTKIADAWDRKSGYKDKKVNAIKDELSKAREKDKVRLFLCFLYCRCIKKKKN